MTTPAGLDIDVTTKGMTTVVSPHGEIDYGNVDVLRAALADVSRADSDEVVVDLSHVTFIDSTAQCPRWGQAAAGRRRTQLLGAWAPAARGAGAAVGGRERVPGRELNGAQASTRKSASAFAGRLNLTVLPPAVVTTPHPGDSRSSR